MRLRTKLVTASMLFTFVLVAVLSTIFLVEVLRERIAQTEAANNVFLHELLESTRDALQHGVSLAPSSSAEETTLTGSVAHALNAGGALQGVLSGLTRYSPDMQDAYLSDTSGQVLIASDPALLQRKAPSRRSFGQAHEASLKGIWHLLFGGPEVLDVGLPLNRNGQPFLVAHLGLRSTFLKEAYAPWLRTAFLLSLLSLIASLLAAAALSAAALRPIETVEEKLMLLSGQPAGSKKLRETDAVERVSSTINRLDEQMRKSEQGRSQMATNLNSMMYALKDGVMLFTDDWLLVSASDAVCNFMPDARKPDPGTPLSRIFAPKSTLGRTLAQVVQGQAASLDQSVELEDGRHLQISFNRGANNGAGALLTLHDNAAEQEFGRELLVAQRLASIGRLMTGVGHEVKNPINAMVVHLELLKGKLGTSAATQPAQRHVEVLSSEMHRLDRVVQTLADFSRPIEPILLEQPLTPMVEAIVALIADDAAERHVKLHVQVPTASTDLIVRGDAELLRQAFLNIALNAMQAMPDGGTLEVEVRRDRQAAEVIMRDSGLGIPADTISRIFDLYFTTKSSGSGIGLSMAYRIVQMHGGTIRVESEDAIDAPDRGSVFTIRLPLVKEVHPIASSR